MDPFRLTFNLRHADGSEKRLADDEPDSGDKPRAFTFDTVNPGGFGQWALPLARDLVPRADEQLLDTIIARGAGGEVAFEGRVHRFPRSRDDNDESVTLQGVGWSSHLNDHRAFREIYRDAMAGSWLTAPSVKRRSNLITGGTKYLVEGQTEAVIDPTDHNPAVRQELTAINGGESGTTYSGATDCRTLCESWYDAGAVPIGKVYYSVSTGQNSGSSMSGTNWVVNLLLSDDDVHTTTQATGDLDGGGSGTLTASGVAKRWSTLQLYYSSTGGSAGKWWANWRLALYGAHGLALRGTEPDAGFYASDIIADVIQRAAPKLTVGTLEDPGFVIPHLVFRDPTTPADVILQANKTSQYDWFVWEDRTFTVQNPDPQRLTWRCRQADGAKVTLEGEDVIQSASSAYVYYQDEWGQQRVYGPTGATDCHLTSDLLLGSGSDPYTLQGINAPMVIRLDAPTVDAIALQLGAVLLAQNNAATRSGQIRLSGFVEHPTESRVPCWRVRAGDYLQITDLPGDVPRKIQQTSYDHQTRTVTCTVGDGPLYRADALLARIGARTGVFG